MSQSVKRSTYEIRYARSAFHLLNQKKSSTRLSTLLFSRSSNVRIRLGPRMCRSSEINLVILRKRHLLCYLILIPNIVNYLVVYCHIYMGCYITQR
jgi:hypothetical protein